MIQVIIQGTIDGHRIFPSENRKALHDTEGLDIRTEIASNFSLGYYIQMYSQGAWVSKAKSMDDGATMRAGYVAVSVYIPNHIVISGRNLKETLDRTLDNYLNTYTDGLSTKSIGVDWSFVTNALEELNAICRPRHKVINTNYTPSNNFAYVPATTEEQIIQLLDKPFQPEYGAYKAVFLGTHLQHPMRLPLQTCLNIDLENEEYDILWNGNKHEWPNLPTKVRKKEINSGSYTFEKKYYNPTTVSYLSGDRDDANTTLILEVPNLQPQINQITLQYNYPEAVVGVTTVPHLPLDQIKDPVLSFKGDEFAREWEVIPLICGDYKCEKISIIPGDCRNGICPVNIIKMQQISLQILENGENRTINYEKNIRISKSGKSIDASLNKVTSSLCLSVPESDDFIKEYAVSLINGTYYSLSNLRAVQSGFYTINIQRKQNSQIINPEPVAQKRPVYLDCKIIDKIEAFYNDQPCKIINNRIEIPFAGTRDKIFVKLGDKKLKFKKVGSDSIKIYSPLHSCLSGGKTRIMLIGIVAMLMLLVSVLLTLQFTNTIDIKKWFAPKEETGQVESSGKGKNPSAIPPADNIFEEQRLYNELDNILKIQRISWNYKTITDLVGKYDTTTVIDKGHMAHPLYKELVWMQCRYRFDGYKKDDLTAEYITHKHFKNNQLNGGWIHGITNYCIDSDRATFATDSIMEFLKSVRDAPDAKQKQFFEQYVKTKKVEKMTFPKVKELWDNFNVSSTSPPKDNKTNKSNNRSSANTGTSAKQSNPPAGENVENY